MKRILIISFLMFFVLSISAQSKSELKKHFKNDIMELDPIEGIYDVEAMVSQSNTPETEKGSIEIYIYKVSEGEFRIHGNSDIRITKIGDTNAYNFVTKYKVASATERVILDNNLRFVRDHEIPQEQIIHDAGRRAAGVKVYIKWDCIKSYPTSSMYAEANKKREQERAQPKEWTGSGFALLEGYLVTNYHVIENAKNIMVQSGSDAFSNKKTATIIASDKVNDLALLKIQGDINTYTLPYSVKTFSSDVGEDVWVLGFPLTSTMGDEIKLTTGVISAKSGYEGDVSMYQISAPIQPGNSGGPVFDGKGNLIGVVCAHHLGAENVSYAIKSLYLRNLIESSVNHDIMPHDTKISGKTLAEQVKAVKDYVYYITCSN